MLPPRVITDHEKVRLEWDRRESHLTVPLDTCSNVANIHHAPGHQQCKLFLQQAQLDDKDWNTGWNSENNKDSEGAPRTVTFDLSPNHGATSETHLVAPNKEDHVENLAAELLRVHHQFNHTGSAKLKMLAKSGCCPSG